MSAVLLLLILAASFAFVRLGAIVLEFTGVPWDRAKFQALSAFSNAGFTTRESEDMLTHPTRRRVITYLIITGNIGLVGSIGTFAGSFVEADLPSFVMNLVIAMVGLVLIIRLVRHRRLAAGFRRYVRRKLIAREGVEVAQDELMRLTDGYALLEIVVQSEELDGLSLAELRLPEAVIVAVKREGATHPAPRGDFVLHTGDVALIYGRPEDVRAQFTPKASNAFQSVSIAPDSGDTTPAAT